jgi:hypothetical protein
VRCPAGPSLVVESQLFARAAPHHLHFVRVVAPGARSAHQLLTEGRRSVELALSTAPPTTGLSAWLGLGMHHVLTGHDHLAFLLALLVGAAGLGALVWTLTGFTLGHALTLGLAALGHLRADTRLVEALIGLSIVVVCVENAWAQSVRGRAWLPVTLVAALVTGALAVPGSPRVTLAAMALSVACSFGLLTRGAPATTWRALLAGTFGLVHGLGFASALGEHALPSTELLPALLGFNLGVEAGQVLAVGLVWSALALLSARRPTLRPRALVLTNAAVCAAGVYWTLTRLG